MGVREWIYSRSQSEASQPAAASQEETRSLTTTAETHLSPSPSPKGKGGLVQRASTTLSMAAQWLFDALGGTTGPESISPADALRLTAFFACVKIIAEDVSSLPLFMMKRASEGSRKKGVDTGHPLHNVLHNEFNPEMSAQSGREAVTMQMLCSGKGYAQIVRGKDGQVAQLWPLLSDRMRVDRYPDNKKLRYTYTLEDGTQRVVPAIEIMAIPGLTMNGIDGMDIVRQGGRALSLARSAEIYASKFFSRRSLPSGYISVPGKLEDDGKELSESWTARTAGEEGTHGTPVLQHSFEFKPIPLPDNAQAQMLDTRNFQNLEVCRLLRMPPNKIGDWSRATWSNWEQAAIEYVGHTLRVWLVRWEQAINRCLVVPVERSVWFSEHNIEGLLRGDIKTRYESYSIGIQWGWLRPDDSRELEGMNPLPNGEGDFTMVPANMVPARRIVWELENDMEKAEAGVTAEEQPEGEAENGETDKTTDGGSGDKGDKNTLKRELQTGAEERSILTRERLMMAYAPLVKRDAARVIRRERSEISSASKRWLEKDDLPSMMSWVSQFYASPPDFIRITMEPVIHSLFVALAGDISEEEGLGLDDIRMQVEVRRVAEDYAKMHAAISHTDTMNLLESVQEGHAGALDAWLSRVEETRPVDIAMKLTQEVGQRAWGWMHPERAN